MNFFQSFGHLAMAIGILLSSFHGHQGNQSITQITSVPSSSVRNDSSYAFYKVYKNFSYEGHNITISLSIPQNGGSVTGNISGDCNGNISGRFDGNNNGNINGEAKSTCQLYFMQIPATATFNGTINKVEKIMQLQVDGQLETFSKTETITVPLN